MEPAVKVHLIENQVVRKNERRLRVKKVDILEKQRNLLPMIKKTY